VSIFVIFIQKEYDYLLLTRLFVGSNTVQSINHSIVRSTDHINRVSVLCSTFVIVWFNF